MIGIYRITNPAGELYIGQSTNIHKRLLAHKHKISKITTLISLSFEKYGYENHVFDILECCDPEILDERERYWQDHYDAIGDKGLNSKLTKTLNKKSLTRQSTIDKISMSNTGKKSSEEHKLKLRNAKLGKSLTISHANNISSSLLGTKRGMSYKNYTPILNTETGIYYDTIKDAAFSINISYQTLWCIINSTRKYRSARKVPFIRA